MLADCTKFEETASVGTMPPVPMPAISERSATCGLVQSICCCLLWIDRNPWYMCKCQRQSASGIAWLVLHVGRLQNLGVLQTDLVSPTWAQANFLFLVLLSLTSLSFPYILFDSQFDSQTLQSTAWHIEVYRGILPSLAI